MIKAMLVLILVTADGAQLVGVEPFESMPACIAEQDRVAPMAQSKLPPGQGYALTCMPIDRAGVES